MDILFNHLNQLDDHIKSTMESPDNERSIPFFDTKCTPNSSHTIHTTEYRKPIHNDRYLDWSAKNPISAKKSVIQALAHRVKVVCSTPKLLAREMDYLNKVLYRNNYPDCFLKKPITGPREIKLPTRKLPSMSLSQFHISKD